MFQACTETRLDSGLTSAQRVIPKSHRLGRSPGRMLPYRLRFSCYYAGPNEPFLCEAKSRLHGRSLAAADLSIGIYAGRALVTLRWSRTSPFLCDVEDKVFLYVGSLRYCSATPKTGLLAPRYLARRPRLRRMAASETFPSH